MSHLHLIGISAVHTIFFLLYSRVKMISINWPAPNAWVFVVQLVEHCNNANPEAMGSNPVAAQNLFSGLIYNSLNCIRKQPLENTRADWLIIVFLFNN